MKKTTLKKLLTFVATILVICLFGALAMGSSSEDTTTTDQGADTAQQDNNSGFTDCKIEIKSCRLAKTYDGKPAVIVMYSYTNNKDTATSFSVAVQDNVFQNGIGLNEAYLLDESANYSADNQMKDIKKGATLDVEVAYELNDSTTDIVVEVEEFISFKDFKVTKTFKIA